MMSKIEKSIQDNPQCSLH